MNWRIVKNIDAALNDVFSMPEYLESKSDEWGYLESEGIWLPFYIKKITSFFRVLFFANKPSQQLERNQLDQLICYIKKEMKIHFIGQPTAHVFFKHFPTGAKAIPFGSYVIDLSKNEEEILQLMHSKHRNAIRKATKDGVRIVSGREYLTTSFEMIKSTMERLNRSYPSELSLKKLVSSDFFVAIKDGVPQGCAILMYGKKSSYYLYGGSQAQPSPGALNLLHYEAMKKMKSLGVEYYDLMGARIDVEKGSKLEGIQRFKSRFGGDLVEGYLWKYYLSSVRGRMFDWSRRALNLVKNRTFTGDAIDQEWKKWKKKLS